MSGVLMPMDLFVMDKKRNYPVGKTIVTKTKDERNYRRESSFSQGADILNDKYQEEASHRY